MKNPHFDAVALGHSARHEQIDIPNYARSGSEHQEILSEISERKGVWPPGENWEWKTGDLRSGFGGFGRPLP